MVLKRIYVNRQRIAQNRDNGTNLPPLSVRTYRGVYPAHEVYIDGPSSVIHSPHSPIPSGARVWIETRSPVTTSEPGGEIL